VLPFAGGIEERGEVEGGRRGAPFVVDAWRRGKGVSPFLVLLLEAGGLGSQKFQGKKGVVRGRGMSLLEGTKGRMKGLCMVHFGR